MDLKTTIRIKCKEMSEAIDYYGFRLEVIKGRNRVY